MKGSRASPWPKPHHCVLDDELDTAVHHSTMEKRSSEKNNGKDDDEEEDRKLPAKEIQVVTKSTHRQRRGRNNSNRNPNNSTFESASNLSTDTASMSSWLSPVARLPPNTATASLQKPAPPAPTIQSSNPAMTTIQPILQSLQTTILLWLATMCMGITVFLYQLLPGAAFSTLAAMVLSSGLFVPVLYHSIADMIQALANAEHSTGILGLILSDEAYTTITGVSLHEYLSHSTPNSDWRFLLLYILPLSDSQRNRAMEHLTLSHRRHLHQPGLLHWIVPQRNTLRYMIGPRGLANMTPVSRRRIQTPLVHESQNHMNNNNTTIEDDDDSSSSSSFDLGLDVSADDMAGGTAGRHMARRLGLTGGGGAEEDDEPSTIVEESYEDEEDEEDESIVVNENDVLINAIWDSAITTVWNPMINSVGQLILPTLVSGLALGSTVFFAAWWSHPSPRNATWTVTLMGSSSALAMLGYQQRYMFRSSSRRNKENSSKQQQP